MCRLRPGSAARRAGDRAIAVARERDDPFCLVNATGTLAFVLASLVEFDEARRLAEQALSVAQVSGHPDGLTVAIVCTAPRSPPIHRAPTLPGLVASSTSILSISATSRPRLRFRSSRSMARVELGLGRLDSATGRLAESVRLADRVGGMHIMHQAAFALGVAAAERGELILACKLVGCADTYLAQFRIANNLQRWLETRLEALLAFLDPVERARATERGAAFDRRGLVRLLRRA
jgi:hypothetical protein